MILDRDGSALLPCADDSEIEGRAAFFVPGARRTLGRIITGDKISLDYRPCACGNKGPSIRDNIARLRILKATTRSAARAHRCLCKRCGMSVIENEVVALHAKPKAIRVNHFIRGKLVTGDEVRHISPRSGRGFHHPGHST